MKQIQKRNLGFTLIELLVVIAIIGVLLSGLIALIDPPAQLQKGKDAKRKADIANIQKGLEQYYDDHNKYPDNTTNYTIIDTNEIAWGTNWPGYMDFVPKDQDGAKRYVYIQGQNGQAYSLYASLDRGSDAQLCSGGVCTGVPQGACGGDCNYQVSSPNVSQ
jgi:type II secretion system protein G